MSHRNQSIGTFSGILEVDSPSAKHLVLKSLGAAAFEKLSEIYRELETTGALLEDDLMRKPEVRYNPRPARLIHILLAEAQCKDLNTIEATLLATKNLKSITLPHLSRLDLPIFLECPHLSILLLDQLRHLHMSRNKSSADLTSQILALLGLSSQGAFEHWPRISRLISAALQRAQRNLPDIAE